MAVVCKSQPSDAENIAGIARPLRVGGAQWRNNILLAPMSGVSDVPFRRAAWRCGAGMVFSEMVASEALVTGHMEMQMKAESAGLPFHVVQLAGRNSSPKPFIITNWPGGRQDGWIMPPGWPRQMAPT